MRRALVGVSLMSDSMEVPRAFGRAGFDDLAHQHEKGDDARRSCNCPEANGREHGDGHQFIDTQPAARKSLMAVTTMG